MRFDITPVDASHSCGIVAPVFATTFVPAGASLLIWESRTVNIASIDVFRRANDEELLAALEHKLQLVRDRTRGVAEGYASGLYLWGDGGTSKSYTVEETLINLGKPYKLSNSRLTGKGLFQLLRDFPDVVHVLDDVETLFADKTSFGVLRSALWGQVGKNGRQERL